MNWYIKFSAFAIVCLQALSVQAADHVLLITLDHYDPASGLSQLDGVPVDRRSALQIASRLGISTSQVVDIKNEQATLSGIRIALENLAKKVQANDQVFVYYSGHGGTKLQAGTCQSSLVTYNNEDLLSEEFFERLAKVRMQLPKRMFVMLDACHSGQFANVAKGATSIRAKFRQAKSDTMAQCNAPVNFVKEGFERVDKSARLAKGTQNEALSSQFVLLSAAKDNEVAWDGERGGAATDAVLRCLDDGKLASLEGNGFLSTEALRQCAQRRIDIEFPVQQRQHLVASGQSTAPLIAAPTATSSGTSSAASTLEALAGNSDPSWQVRAEPYVGQVRREDVSKPFQWANKARIRIGSNERLQLSVLTPRDGYLYLVYASRDSNQFALLYPTDRQDSFVRANQTPLTIHRRWPAQGNNGAPEQDTILAIVSEQPWPDLHEYLQGASQPATEWLSQRLAQSSSTPCASFGSDSGQCRRSPGKSLGAGESTEPPVQGRRYGVAKVLVDEY
ncbi:MAG: DUF4384 domain-containing protein [Rhodoferax sp.]|nr:MAG: DUF4384 domain-containing protein [Rhodoferax sp.]